MSIKVNTNTPLVLFAVMSVCTNYAAADRFSAGVGLQEYWDSNFSRTPDADSEHYTQASAFAAVKYQLSRQALAARVRGYSYTYAQRDDLDTDFYDGDASWRSEWSSRLKTEVSWNRMAYMVDRLEFAEQDVVARDDINAMFTYGTGNRLSFSAGGRQTAQTHSNDLREDLDFDEEEVFAELAYQAGGKSTLSLRVRDGIREYPSPLLGSEFRDLDYDYQHAELEGVWVASPKTSVKANIGYVERIGEINESDGVLASLSGTWEMTDKLQLSAGYGLKRPSVGDTSDTPSAPSAPSQEDSIFFSVDWQPLERWKLNSGVKYSRQAYERSELEIIRDENIYSVTPLLVGYRFSKLLSFKFESRWVERESPLIARDHSFALASLGVALQF